MVDEVEEDSIVVEDLGAPPTKPKADNSQDDTVSHKSQN